MSDERLSSALEFLVDQYRVLDGDFEEDEKSSDQRMYSYLIETLGQTPKIAIIERLLKYYKEVRDEIVRTDIPMLMAEYGMRSAETIDGTKIGMSTFYETKQLDKQAVADWLEKVGYGDIIKDNLALSKGSFDQRLEEFLSNHGYTYSRDSSINGMQLKAAVKKHLESGGDFPPVEAMSVSIYEQADIKKSKRSF
jgi:hypothetical protein